MQVVIIIITWKKTFCTNCPIGTCIVRFFFDLLFALGLYFFFVCVYCCGCCITFYCFIFFDIWLASLDFIVNIFNGPTIFFCQINNKVDDDDEDYNFFSHLTFFWPCEYHRNRTHTDDDKKVTWFSGIDSIPNTKGKKLFTKKILVKRVRKKKKRKWIWN